MITVLIIREGVVIEEHKATCMASARLLAWLALKANPTFTVAFSS